MEGYTLLNMVKDREYNTELRLELVKAGLLRINKQEWICKATANRFELIMSDKDDLHRVTGVDQLVEGRRIHIKATAPDDDMLKSDASAHAGVASLVGVHHKTLAAFERQRELASQIFDKMDMWNDEISRGTVFGNQLKALVGLDFITWENFLFLPDPLASGSYILGAIRQGKAASLHAWLNLRDGNYIVPIDGSDDMAFASLADGQKFHDWEFRTFATPAAAGQYAIGLINNTESTYAQTIRRMLGKEAAPVTRNDFYRNVNKEMCRIEVDHDQFGVHVLDVPTLPTLADSIDCLLAPHIRSNALLK